MQAHFYRVYCIKDGFLVLLHIFVVGECNALHHRQQGGQIAENAAAFATYQLGDVRVFLLGHNAGTGGKGVVQFHKLKLPGAPHNDLLAKAGQVHHHQRECCRQLNAKVPVGHPVQAVGAYIVKAQLRRHHLPVDGIGGAGQSAAAQGQHIHAFFYICQSIQIAAQHGGIGH